MSVFDEWDGEDAKPGPQVDGWMARIVGGPVLPYSTDMGAAWRLVEWCIERGAAVCLGSWPGGPTYYCTIFSKVDGDQEGWTGQADSTSLAICGAMLGEFGDATD